MSPIDKNVLYFTQFVNKKCKICGKKIFRGGVKNAQINMQVLKKIRSALAYAEHRDIIMDDRNGAEHKISFSSCKERVKLFEKSHRGSSGQCAAKNWTHCPISQRSA